MTGDQGLARAIGQLIVGKVSGTSLDRETESALAAGTIGGITLFKENASDLKQLVGLIESIHAAAAGTAIVAVDQEGGAVQRFDHILTPLPSAMSLAAAGSLELASAVTAVSARQLWLAGVNCLFAPCLDVMSNPLNTVIATRSFGDDPSAVADFGLAEIEAIAAGGLLAVGKHFPGHGSTMEDSHTDFAVNRSQAKLLWRRDLGPYRQCLPRLPAVLTSHVWLPAIDREELPASISPRVTGGLLRDYLGFSGLVFTDDMLMKGLTGRFGVEEASIRAILAGADQLLVCGDLETSLSVGRALGRAVDSGRLSEKRIARSIERRGAALAALGRQSRAEMAAGERIAAIEASLEAAAKKSLAAAIQGTAIVRGQRQPVGEQALLIVAPAHARYRMDLAAAVRACLPGSSTIEQLGYSLSLTSSDIEAISAQASGKPCIFVSYRALASQEQAALARRLAQTALALMHVCAELPHDIMVVPDWPNSICAFDPSDLAMSALAAVLTGRAEPGGKVPVSLTVAL